MNLLAALVNQCFGPQGAGLTEIKGALCLSRLPHVCFYYKYCWCNCNRCKQCRPVLGCSYRSSLMGSILVWKTTECVKSLINHFNGLLGRLLLITLVRRPICVIWDNKRVVQHVHKHWFARTFFVDLESILANPCNFMIIYCPVGQEWWWPHALFAKLLGT